MHKSLKQKAQEVLHERGGFPRQPGGSVLVAQTAIEQALAGRYPAAVARDMAFHLTDWQSDVLLLLAIQLFPERFTPDEIQQAIGIFLCHAPNHIVAAAKLGGYLVTDVWGIGGSDVS